MLTRQPRQQELQSPDLPPGVQHPALGLRPLQATAATFRLRVPKSPRGHRGRGEKGH